MQVKVVDRSEKLERIYQILRTVDDVTPPEPPTSVLAQGIPDGSTILSDPARVGLRGLLAASALLSSVFFLPSTEPFIAARMVALVGSVLVLAAMLREFFRADRAYCETKNRVEQMAIELNQVRGRLDRYLVALDTRTSRYFHCVTSTKVTTYCVLRQILVALEERLLELQDALRAPTVSGVRRAAALLRKEILFRDGYTPGVGQIFVVPVPRVASIIELVIKDLESGLAELEEEISHVRQQAAPIDTIEHHA